MKRVTPILFLLFFAVGCRNREEKAIKPEHDIDAAREFIRAALDGNFERARQLLLADSINLQYIDVAERSYERADSGTKAGYRRASINIHEVMPLNDSASVVVFSNSFKNDHDSLRVVRQSGDWRVDLKFLYENKPDTLHPKKP
ncbi:MAG TPA: hypothetical protein VEB63_01680 [Chitinophagaceae bacterium]|nr:hypothetical protein [Chitinophagaceae bacterium]